MRIAQISDTHISLDVLTRLVELERCVAQINALDPPADLAVHTGDVSHDGLQSQYDAASQLLGQLTIPLFVMVGNKDNRRALCDAFPEQQRPCRDTPFVQYAVETFPVRIVCIDTLCETSNKGELCQDRLADLDRLLSIDADRPTVVFMHHPPFEVPVAPDPFQFVSRDNANACMELLKQHSSIRGLFCGHVHRPFATHVGCIPASVMTAVALDLRFGESKPHAPDTPLFVLHEIGITNAC